MPNQSPSQETNRPNKEQSTPPPPPTRSAQSSNTAHNSENNALDDTDAFAIVSQDEIDKIKQNKNT